MRIEYLSDSHSARWDSYVGARARAVTDLFAWRHVARESYGIASHFLLAEDNGVCAGALALYEIRHPVFGHYLATALFGTDGGLFSDSDAARDALVAEARALAIRLKVSYLVIRTRGVELRDFQKDYHLRTALIPLDGTAEDLLARLPGKTRNQVRRGQREGFAVSSGADQVAAFHDVFHRHMRRLGSPAHSLRYYKAIALHLGERAEFFVVRDGTQLVAGALLCFVNGMASNLHTVALAEYNTRCPNYLLYWRMMEESRARGCRQMDLGRSAIGSSQLAFKENWRPNVLPLCYNYFVLQGGAPRRIDADNPRYRLAIAAWRRMPLFVTRALGPHLISGIA